MAAKRKARRAPRGSGSRWTDARGRTHIRLHYRGVWIECASADPARTEAAVATRKAAIDRDAAEAERAIDSSGSRQTLTAFFSVYLAHISPSLKPSTIADYELLAELYILPTLGDVALRDLNTPLIQRWLDALSGVIAANTVKRARGLLTRALARARVLAYVDNNAARDTQIPRTARTRVKANPRRPLTVDEARKVLALAGKRPTQKSRSGGEQQVANWRDLTIAVWFGLLGLRRGEILGLRIEDLDLAAGVAPITRAIQEIGGKIAEETPKGDKARSVPLPAALVTEIRAELLRSGRREGWLLATRGGGPMRPSRLYTSYQALCTRAELTTPRRLHDLRHTSAAILRDLGCPKELRAALLGHAAEDMAEHYAGQGLAPLRPWVERLARTLVGGVAADEAKEESSG